MFFHWLRANLKLSMRFVFFPSHSPLCCWLKIQHISSLIKFLPVVLCFIKSLYKSKDQHGLHHLKVVLRLQVCYRYECVQSEKLVVDGYFTFINGFLFSLIVTFSEEYIDWHELHWTWIGTSYSWHGFSFALNSARCVCIWYRLTHVHCC